MLICSAEFIPRLEWFAVTELILCVSTFLAKLCKAQECCLRKALYVPQHACVCFCDPEQNSHLLDLAQFLSNQKG